MNDVQFLQSLRNQVSNASINSFYELLGYMVVIHS